MKKLLWVAICFAFTLNINAQTIDKKWNIGLHGGLSQYKGDLGNDFYRTDMAMYGLGGVSASMFIANHFDINMMVTKGVLGFDRPSGNFRRNVSTATVNFRFNIIGHQYFVLPYLFVGGGVALFDKNLGIDEKAIDYIAPSFGGGINFKLGPTIILNLQESFLYSSNDHRDGVDRNENDMYLFHTVGLTFNFGNKRDADGDGVSDFRDKCPNTPSNVAVDKDGCALDRDGDGVPDYLDECPDQPGTAALNGCPDRDGDGVADKDDECPDEKGLASLNGCPDRDGDGVADKDDRCPDDSGTLALKGCPDSDSDGVADLDDNCPNTPPNVVVDQYGCPVDTDGDGIADYLDECPNEAGPLALNGCPDTDGDGVADKYDRCPDVKGTIENFGCPEMAVEDVKKITNIASRIFFETNSDQLKVASLAQLDELVIILKKYEEANLTIEGHADSQGDDDYNLTLSQKRTESVKEYLMEKGILESRLTAIGYGESQPIADNNTEIGRAKNRRVALKTSY